MADLARELLDVLATTPATQARALQELTLRTSLARALVGLHGLTDEVEDEYRRALALFEGEREVPQLFPVLRGLASLHGFRAEFDKALPVSNELLRLAEAQDSQSMRVDAHLLVGVGLAFTGDLEGGLKHLEDGIKCFESQRHGSHRFQVGPNPGVASLHDRRTRLVAARIPGSRLERANRAVTLATELRQPFTMAYALYHTGFLHLLRQEPEPMRERGVGVARRCGRVRAADLEGARHRAARRGEDGPGPVRRGPGGDRGRGRPVPGTPEPAGVLAAAALRPRAGVRAGRTASAGPRLHRPVDRDRRRWGRFRPSSSR